MTQQSSTIPNPNQVLHEYRKERYADFNTRSSRLDDLAFKTSERYDQWVLTLSGGALAISLTFLEKIAPEPESNTLWLLGFSWLSFIAAILGGFFAIHYSREAIYREIDIARENYEDFISNSTLQNLEGNSPSKKDNIPRIRVGIANGISKWCLALGTALLCSFALLNLFNAKNLKNSEEPKEASIRFYLSPSAFSYITNLTLYKNMSTETNKPVVPSGNPPSAPDSSLKGIRIGDPAEGIKGSYKPIRQQDAPPPPPPPPTTSENK